MSALVVGTAFFCLVVSVHDGDTWTCHGGTKVRLRGADAFELKEPGGRQARDFMRARIMAQRLTCWIAQERDSHGRVAAACSLPALGDLSELLVANGHARACKAFGGEELNAVEPNPIEGPAWCEGTR